MSESSIWEDIRKGIIVLNDPAQLEILYSRLKDNIGKPLTEIGDLELDYFRPIHKKRNRQVRPFDNLNVPERIFK
jgi:hypothetical protein